MKILYDGNYDKFKKSVEEVTGLFINCACSPEGGCTPLTFWLGIEYHPKVKQKEIQYEVNKDYFLMFPHKFLMRKILEGAQK